MGTLAPELWIFIYSLVLIVAHLGICLTDVFDFISTLIKNNLNITSQTLYCSYQMKS